MTPELSTLVGNADAAKQRLLLLTAGNQIAAQLASQATERHAGCYAAVQGAAKDLADARTAIDAALDADYGQATPAKSAINLPESAASNGPPVAEAATDVAIVELTSTPNQEPTIPANA